MSNEDIDFVVWALGRAARALHEEADNKNSDSYDEYLRKKQLRTDADRITRLWPEVERVLRKNET